MSSSANNCKRWVFEVALECNGSRGADRALNGKFDVILLSSQLSIIGGEDVLKLLRQAGIRTPSILLGSTNPSHSNDEAATSLAQRTHYLPEPVSSSQLQTCLREALPQFTEMIRAADSNDSVGHELHSDLIETFERHDYRQLSELLQQLRAETPVISSEFQHSLDRLDEILNEEDQVDSQLDEIRSSLEELAAWKTSDVSPAVDSPAASVRTPK